MSAPRVAGLDRRTFLGATGLTLTVGALAPTVLFASPSVVPPSQISPWGEWSRAAWSDWSIDDMWSHLPRATARIGLGRRGLRRCSLDVAAIDRQFCG